MRVMIRMDDIIQQGATVGCAGCKSAIKQSRNRLPHSPACRARFEKLLGGEERAKRAKKRSDEYVSKVLEADDLKRNPKKAKIDEETAENMPAETESEGEDEEEGPARATEEKSQELEGESEGEL